MQYKLLKEMYELEKDYWWHRAKRLHVLSLIKKFGNQEKPTILDIGCGTGYLLKEMENIGKTYGIDKSKFSLSFCKKRGLKNIRLLDIEKKSFPITKFDIVTALDVIEHIKDDKKVMKNIHKSLKKHGILIVSVPAFQSLWTYWDEAAGHMRRYDKDGLKNLLEETGFEIEYIKFTNFISFLPAFAVRLVKNNSKKQKNMSSDFIKLPPFLNELVFKIMKFEIIFSSLFSPPCGLSLIAVGRKTRLL